jgi:hypothetical protein
MHVLLGSFSKNMFLVVVPQKFAGMHHLLASIHTS